MVAPLRQIFWDKEASDYLRRAITYIRQDSPKNADTVKSAIFNSIRRLAEQPYSHPPDKFRKDNDGSYRAFEIMKFRVAYFVDEHTIFIIRVRHVSMEPLGY